MKVTVLCVLALASLANGQDGIREELTDELATSLKNPYEHLLRTRRTIQVCTPDSRKMLDCNSCFCVTDGSGWACTEMACPPKLPAHDQKLSERVKRAQICKPDTIRTVECNNCLCNGDGTAERCTRMMCP